MSTAKKGQKYFEFLFKLVHERGQAWSKGFHDTYHAPQRRTNYRLIMISNLNVKKMNEGSSKKLF